MLSCRHCPHLVLPPRCATPSALFRLHLPCIARGSSARAPQYGKLGTRLHLLLRGISLSPHRYPRSALQIRRICRVITLVAHHGAYSMPQETRLSPPVTMTFNPFTSPRILSTSSVPHRRRRWKTTSAVTRAYSTAVPNHERGFAALFPSHDINVIYFFKSAERNTVKGSRALDLPGAN